MACAGTSDNADVPSDAVGPDRNADVQLADADNWTVPLLDIDEFPEFVVWTLVHPLSPTKAVVQRHCDAHVAEPWLWLRDPTDSGGAVVAMLHGCHENEETHGTVTLAYDGNAWTGVSANGAATLVPQN